MKLKFLLAAAPVALLSVASQPARAADPAPEPTRIIIECEDMQGVAQDKFGPGPSWQVGRWGKDLHQNMVFGGVWASRLRVAMADAGDSKAEATAVVEVPADATYKVWAKYECPPFFNYAFGLRIQPENGGAAVYDKTYGLIDAAKHFSFNDSLVKGNLYWNWGIDHDAAEGYEVKLPKGRYRVTLYKTNNPAPAGARSVDTILITTDLSPISAPRFPRYPLLDELRRANHVYFRFHNKGTQPMRVAWNHWGHRPPDYYHAIYRELVRYYDAAGKPLTAPENHNGNWAEPVAPGGTSVWYDLGPTMNTESTSPFYLKALPADSNLDFNATWATPSFPFGVDIALAPDAAKIVKSFDLGAGETELDLLVQPNLAHKDGVENTVKNADVYANLTKWLNAEPRLGPLPKKMKFFSNTGVVRYGGAAQAGGKSWDFDLNMGFREALGINTLILMGYDATTKPYIDAQLEWGARHGGILPRSAGFVYSQDAKEVIEKVKPSGASDNFYYMSYGDEIGLPAVDIHNTAQVEAFRAFVKARGETPKSLGVENWDAVKPLAELSADVAVQIGVLPQSSPKTVAESAKLKRLYWYSLRFRDEQGLAKFAGVTRDLQAAFGPGTHTTANLGGMHPFYWMNQSSFIDGLKYKAMSLGWSEDYTYCQPEASRLVVDFEASYLRKGGSYNDTPLMFYCMPHYPGNTPEHLLQNAVLLWANNIKDIDWFAATPDAWSTENHIIYPDGLPVYKSIRQIAGMAGAIEDELMPARTTASPVAMLLSKASDVWEVEGQGQGIVAPGTSATNVSQEERKNIWYALRLAGYRVDFVTEDDVKDGLLKNYKVLYVCGQNIERGAATALKNWVQGGGIVMATAGAARKDEFDEPLTSLDEVLGRGAVKSYDRFKGPLRAKMELLFEKPKDLLQLDGVTLDVLCSIEKFTAARKAEVLGKYKSDGSPALIKNRFGAGTAYYTGALPGQTFVRRGLPLVPMGKGGSETNSSQFEPVDYDAVAQGFILRPLTESNITADIAVNHRAVVCGRMAGPTSTILPIVNLAEQHDGQLKNVEIRVKNLAKSPRKAWSPLHKEGVTLKQDGADWIVTLPTLQTADVIVLAY